MLAARICQGVHRVPSSTRPPEIRCVRRRDGGPNVDQSGSIVVLAGVSSCRYLDVRDCQLWPVGTGGLVTDDPAGRSPCLVLSCLRPVRQPGAALHRDERGRSCGVSQPRGSFFIDVKPGFYRVTVQQYLDSPEEAANINLVPDQQVYLEIVSLTDRIAGAGGLRSPATRDRASMSGTYRPRLRKQT
jgi:hypothetical protein